MGKYEMSEVLRFVVNNKTHIKNVHTVWVFSVD